MTDSRQIRPHRIARVIFNVVIPLVFLAVVAAVVWDRREELRPLIDDPSWTLGLVVLLVVGGHALTAAEYWVLYRAQGVVIAPLPYWMVFSAGNLGNLAPAQLGTLYRFRYMKTAHETPYTQSAANFGADLVVNLIAASAFGLVAVVAEGVVGDRLSVVMFLAFTGTLLAALSMSFLPVPSLALLRGRPARLWRSLRQAWEELRVHRRTGVVVVGIATAKYLVTAWRLQLAFSIIGFEESFAFFAVLAPVAAIAGIVAFTPGGLGIRELFITTAAVMMGSTAATGLLAATVDRGAMLLVAVFLGTAGYAYTYPRLRAASDESQPTVDTG